MRTHVAVLAWLVVLLLAASGCSGEGPASSTDEPPAPSARAVQTLTYDEEGHEMDLYLPAGRPPTAMVLLVHGAGLGASPKDHEGFTAWGTRLATAGVAAAVPNHEAVVGGSAAGVSQLRRAVRVLRDHVADLAHDPVPLLTMGFSAGGPDWVEASFDPANQPVAALVGYYAEVEPPPTSGADGRASLSHHLLAGDRPVLLAYGRADTAPGILASLRAFRRATRGADVDATILTHPTAGHGFDLQDDVRTRTIIDRTVAFVLAAADGPRSAAAGVGQVAQAGRHLGELPDDPLGHREERPTLGREGQPAYRSVDDHDAERPLEALDPGAEARLRHVEAAGGDREATAVHDREEGSHLAQGEVEGARVEARRTGGIPGAPRSTRPSDRRHPRILTCQPMTVQS